MTSRSLVPSVSEKLHAKIEKTLSNIPKEAPHQPKKEEKKLLNSFWDNEWKVDNNEWRLTNWHLINSTAFRLVELKTFLVVPA